jgi:hypothetical protein
VPVQSPHRRDGQPRSESAANPNPPVADAGYRLNGAGQRARVLVYDPGALLGTCPLAFVGFVSQQHPTLEAETEQALHDADSQLAGELTRLPRLLGYYSRELLPGQWCNLVILSDADAKLLFRDLTAHRRGAYEHAPRSYAWIRLHTGVLRHGLRSRDLDMQHTRFYRCTSQPADFDIRAVSHARAGPARCGSSISCRGPFTRRTHTYSGVRRGAPWFQPS